MEESFVFTENHLSLIRNMVVGWDITEIGAPIIHPQIPYGTPNLFKDIKQLTGITKRGAMKTLHREMENALIFFLEHAALSPGHYSYPNKLKDIEDGEAIDITAYEKDEKPETISFQFTDKHLKLMRYASVRWNDDWEDEDWEDGYPTPGIDPKRPYGAMTYYEIDMATALDIKYDVDKNGHAMFSPEQEESFHKLHEDMQCALQVFLLYAELSPELIYHKKTQEGNLQGKVFVLTGALESMTRNQAKTLIEKAGGKVTDSVSKNTSFVIVGDSPGSKLDKAKKLGIPVIDEMTFKKMCEA